MNDKILICEMLKTPTDAFLKFKQENCRFPGDCDDTELESDKQNILSSINRNIAEPYVEVNKETYNNLRVLCPIDRFQYIFMVCLGIITFCRTGIT